MKRQLFSAILMVSAIGIWGSCTTASMKKPAAFETKAEPQQAVFELSLQVGDMKFEYIRYSGIRLTVHDSPMITGSALYVVQPGWVPPRYYGMVDNPFLIRDALIEPYQGGKRVTLFHQLPPEYDCPFEGKEVFTLLPNNTFEAHLEFVFKKKVPAQYEWTIGRIPVTSFIGADYTVRDAAGSRTGRIPFEAPDPNLIASAYAHNFYEFAVASRMGDITFTATPDDKILLGDYRKNQYADVDNPILWLGNMGSNIRPFERVSRTLSIKFPEKPIHSFKDAVVQSKKLSMTPASDVLFPVEKKDVIIPTPKHVRYTEDKMPLGDETKIFIGRNPGQGVEYALQFLLKDLKDLYDLEPQVIRDEPSVENLPSGSIYIGESSRFQLPAGFCNSAGLAIPDHEEGYALRVTPNLTAVAAGTERGVFNGITTLVQLFRLNRQGVWLRGAEITDYPALGFRGVQVYAGPDTERDLPLALRESMARYKINHLVINVDHVIWDRHPELEYKGRAMRKEQMQTVLDAARENMIEVIPMIQSLGHMDWMFVNGQNTHLAEDPDMPYAINPTDPRSFEFLQGVFEEAVEFFQPQYFHLGLDEVTMRGRFPWRSRWTGKSVGQLFAETVQKHHAWFAERGIEVMLWGDMLLSSDVGPDAHNAESPEDALLARSLLPRDVIITDWHYARVEPERFRSLGIFRDEGLRTIGSGWDKPENIANFAKACVLNASLGYLQTTWAGWNFKILGNEPEWYQFWAYILAAQYSWTGENDPLEELAFDPREVFLASLFPEKPHAKPRPGFLVDISPLANRSLTDNEQKTGWLGYGPQWDFSSLPRGKNLFERVQFLIEKNEQGGEAVLLAAPFNPPGDYPRAVEMVLLPVKASELHFLMNAAFRTRNGTHAGDITVHYEDGSSQTMPLHYGRELFVPEESRIGQVSRIAWEGVNPFGQTIRLWNVVWKNPSPEKKINKVILSSQGTQAAPLLYAVSGVE